jgi:N-acetylneuraminic acid mutarotase
VLASVGGGLLLLDPVKSKWEKEPLPNGTYLYQSDTSVIWTGKVILAFGGTGCHVADDICPIAESVDPSTGEVMNLSLKGAPSFRGGATSVWTGAGMVVWGGMAIEPTQNVEYSDGALYDPATDSWTPMSQPPGSKAAYQENTAVWTGSQMLVWGGLQGTAFSPGSLAYYPKDDTWTTLPTDGQPSGRGGHVAVWTGTEMIVWGGAGFGVGAFDTAHPFADGGAYNPATHTWRSISAPNTGLFGAASAWTGTEMLVWGGYDEYSCGGAEDCPGSDLGYRYNPTTDQWQYITTKNAPSPRIGMGAVWTGKSLVILGGDEAGIVATDGAEWSP